MRSVSDIKKDNNTKQCKILKRGIYEQNSQRFGFLFCFIQQTSGAISLRITFQYAVCFDELSWQIPL